jgi:predicted RecA/RadA family phage recombinase
MQNYVHKGEALTVVAPYTINSGGGVKVGNLFGVAVFNAAIGASLEIITVGVFDLAKDSSTFNSGDAVYWDDTNKVATSASAGNLVIGTAELSQASGTNAPGGAQADPAVRVRLNGFLPGATGVSTGIRVAHFLYNFAVDGGVSCTPANSDTIPANAVVHGGVITSTTAVTATGAATVAIGTTADAGNNILTATGKATLSADAVLKAACATTPFKQSVAGQINVTIATGPLTAGVIEGWVFYSLATNA